MPMPGILGTMPGTSASGISILVASNVPGQAQSAMPYARAYAELVPIQTVEYIYIFGVICLRNDI
jgi:hypothetical protein